jgi:hypothetical protein
MFSCHVVRIRISDVLAVARGIVTAKGVLGGHDHEAQNNLHKNIVPFSSHLVRMHFRRCSLFLAVISPC